MNSDFFVSKCHQKFSSNYNKEEMTQKYLRENFWEVYNLIIIIIIFFRTQNEGR